MPLTRNIRIEDPRFVRLDRRHQFVRDLARVILADHDGFENVWSIANRVYDRHCSTPAGSPDRGHFDDLERTALSA